MSRISLRTLLRRFGFDLVRYPQRSPNPLRRFLNTARIDTVLDVGANVGQYAMALRELGFTGRIVSFEPNPEAFEQLHLNASDDRLWQCHNIALGETKASGVLHVSRTSVLSSLLPISGYVEELVSGAQVEREEQVIVQTLDDLWPDLVLDGRRVLLKIDTQGYEQQVLRGASHCSQHLLGVQMELSLCRLYVGQPQIEDMISLMRERGFAIYSLWSGFGDSRTGQLLEVDGLFFRESGWLQVSTGKA